jgi:hypothetical protein
MSPIPPPAVVAPYDNLESCLNLARTRLNDAIQAIGGDILTDAQPFTAAMTNGAWRKLQAYLANLGFAKYKRKYFAYALPVVATTDPSISTQWSWTFFFDGTSYYETAASVLPNDLICPLYLKERQTGSNGRFYRMQFCPDGLPEFQKLGWNRYWEWKNDIIYMPGSTFSMDLEVEYAAYDYDFVVTAGVLGNPGTSPPTTPANMQVPIMRCQSSLANYIAAECAMGRDDVDVQSFVTTAEADAKLIVNNEVKLKQRTPVQRQAYSGNRGRDQLWGSRGY